jgi:fatty acid amide hydrolase 2
MSANEGRFEKPGHFQLVKQMFLDFTHNKSSIILFLLTWPMALILVIFAHFKRIWAIGNAYQNASHLVNIEDPTVMDPVLALSASEMGRRIRDPEDPLTSVQIVDACFRHIKRINPYIQAVVALRVTEAREEAARADLAVREGTVPDECSHFWGVPILVKECFEMVGMPYTAGIYGRKGIVGTDMCSALAKLQQNEGAIILGSTNVSEACMYHESSNHVYGSTHNPYDFRRTAGGSSGGCGAAVAACCAPFAVTSDVGGSTRIPALYNGLFGHKPTGGAISNSNTMPLCGTGDIKRYCQLGPTCRYAEDMWPLFKAMVSNDGPVHGLRGNPEVRPR